MGGSVFNIDAEQRKTLIACWKRTRDRNNAASYLQEVERLIAYWQRKNNLNQPSSIKQQIELARNLRINVEKTPALLENLPQDFEKLLAVVWLRQKYGDEYFKLHKEACRKDNENNTALKLALEAVVRALAPDKETPHLPAVTEFSILPPNYFQQTRTDVEFLRITASAAAEIEWMLRYSKAWLDTPSDEVDLLFLLAYSYESHFGKLPSAGNKGGDGYPSPFRSFLGALSKIISAQSSGLREYKLGAVMTRRVLEAIKKNRSMK